MFYPDNLGSIDLKRFQSTPDIINIDILFDPQNPLGIYLTGRIIREYAESENTVIDHNQLPMETLYKVAPTVLDNVHSSLEDQFTLLKHRFEMDAKAREL